MWIDPVIFEVGFLQVRWYGLVYAFGILLLYFFVSYFRKNMGLTKDLVDLLIIYLISGMLIGARIFHFLFSDPMIFFTNPLELLMVWHGGMSFFGGLLGVIISGLYFCNKHKKEFFLIADFIILPTALTLVFGRIANYINNELIGTITSVPWCVTFPIAQGCRHPYPLYASFSHLIMFFILLALFNYNYKFKKKNNKKSKSFSHGTLFFSFVFLYSVFRFITDFFRDDPHIFGITSWQMLSIITAIISIFFLIRINKKNKNKNIKR